jgi:phytoene/squalene synthetase
VIAIATRRPRSSPESLVRSYRHCERVTRANAANFYYGIRLLPGSRRRALCAIYALARRIDDVADGELADGVKLAELARAREELDAIDAYPGDPVLVALADAVERYPIPLAAFDDLVEGAELDVRGTRYATFDELAHYCRCVAGSIGRLTLGVLEVRDRERADTHAVELGVALQLTNILRDLREDLGRGRVYLPAEDLVRFGCRLDGFMSGVGSTEPPSSGGAGFAGAGAGMSGVGSTEPPSSGGAGFAGAGAGMSGVGSTEPPSSGGAGFAGAGAGMSGVGSTEPPRSGGAGFAGAGAGMGPLPELIRFEAARAREWLDRGLRVLPLLDRQGAACVGTMAGIYARVLARIEREPALVLGSERVSLAGWEKGWVAVRSLTAGGV